MLLEEQRLAHEDIERLENAIADRLREEPRNIRDRLARDHQINGFVKRIQEQSARLLDLYNDSDGARTREIQSLSAGDPYESFKKQYNLVKDYHRKYPNEPVENIERSYRRRGAEDGGPVGSADIENMFTGEEGYGRFFDLTRLHEEYLNLPGVKGARRPTYLQYLDIFDVFVPPQCPIKRPEKMTDAYFQYLGSLSQYLDSFMHKTKPLEDLDKLFASFDKEFDEAWTKGDVPGWAEEHPKASTDGPKTEGSGEGVWCADCEAEFKNENVYKNHLNGKKHKRAVEAKKNGEANGNGVTNATENAARRLKEKAVAAREFRIKKMTSAMQTERGDTRVNVERKQGMTDRERAQELEALFAEADQQGGQEQEEGSDDDEEEKIYNPLKLPLAWDGKPIPFWLYKLHGLGVEFPCEICGNFVYMGRRAFDKHFSESRHTWGLKALGITNTGLFREITGIKEAINLWDKIQRDKKVEKTTSENVVQMEDAEGNVMPEKVYYDLQKQGLL